MNINSKEYWDERFDTNWLDYAGDKHDFIFCRTVMWNVATESGE